MQKLNKSIYCIVFRIEMLSVFVIDHWCRVWRSLCAASTTECTSQQFQCRRSGLCIDLRYKCDQRDDCDDASDEADCGKTLLQLLHVLPSISMSTYVYWSICTVSPKETTLIFDITSSSV